MDNTQEAARIFEHVYYQGLQRRFWQGILQNETELSKLADSVQDSKVSLIVEQGTHSIAIDQIIGSISGNQSFDDAFYPRRKDVRHRWISILLARWAGQALPPIEVVQLGEHYYVVDGHHRVSVARFLGQAYIDAHVVAWHIEQAQDTRCLIFAPAQAITATACLSP